MGEFSWRTRKDNLIRLGDGQFDLLIIGGGITGAGLALDASLRGLKTALVEKRDFAAGTSSRSTKLIHGGLRYLEHFDFALVREGLRERAILTRIAPHLAEAFPFLVPIYRQPGRNYSHPLIMRAGMILYDLLAGRCGIGRHRRLSREEALSFAPQLDSNGLKGALLYYDGRTNDSRLVIEVLKSANRYGACLVNHAAVTGFVRDGEGNLTGARVTKPESGADLICKAKVIINATGVWMEDTLRLPGGLTEALEKCVRPSKGIHLTVSLERLPVSGAWLIPALIGHRFYFVVPWEGRVNIGTTDTDYQGDKDSPRAIEDEVREILAAINAYFPQARLGQDDVISGWAGLRPLISAPGIDNTTDVSRKEEVIESPDGLISIAGGKLTTYRLMAEHGIDLAMKRLGSARRSMTDRTPICGGEMDRTELAALAARISAEARIPMATAEHLVFNYGSETPHLIDLLNEDESLREPLVTGLPHLSAEIVYAVRQEMTITLADLMARRTRLAMLAGRESLDAANRIVLIMAREMGWSEEERKWQLVDWHREFIEEYSAGSEETLDQ